MYRECIRQSKPLPDFSRTSEHSVWVTLHGEIQDPEFLRFLEEIGRERQASFTTEDFLVIDLVHREQPVPRYLAPRLPVLREQGVIERVGRGRGTRHLLSRRFYRFLGKGGAYTRRRGLDRETNKALLLRHIEDSTPAGTTLGELQQVLPNLSRDQVRTLLRELKRAGRIEVRGATKAGRWFLAGPKPNSTQ
ncbi:MAG: transcriptional regulator, partial [Planctomycetes bacterium]|nr:transcriptional regulator [Planctomycetota bacterium]